MPRVSKAVKDCFRPGVAAFIAQWDGKGVSVNKLHEMYGEFCVANRHPCALRPGLFFELLEDIEEVRWFEVPFMKDGAYEKRRRAE